MAASVTGGDSDTVKRSVFIPKGYELATKGQDPNPTGGGRQLGDDCQRLRRGQSHGGLEKGRRRVAVGGNFVAQLQDDRAGVAVDVDGVRLPDFADELAG
jgi:hypothetical protein